MRLIVFFLIFFSLNKLTMAEEKKRILQVDAFGVLRKLLKKHLVF